MATWVALLRAVNLGARNKVPMAQLRDALDAAGLENVRTYIQSGNVVFEADTCEASALEAIVAKEFGVTSVVILRTARQVRALARSRPLGADTTDVHAIFLRDRPPRSAARRLEEVAGGNEFALVGSDVAVRYPSGYQGAILTNAVIEKTLGIPGTGRNWRTVEKLADLTHKT
jgi:uncharacterized protein (DUF1697 family)